MRVAWAAICIALSFWGASPANAALPPPAPFDARRAYRDLVTQCDFGPRVPGTQAHTECAHWLAQTLYDSADAVSLQRFTATVGGKTLPLANIVATLNPTGTGHVLLAAHWDTRPTADRDPDPANRTRPILGANDGASGVAVLLELARAFGSTPPPVPVIIALFDAEDSGSSVAPPPYYGFLLGSDYYVDHWPDGGRPDEVILVDMVGGDSRPNDRVGTRPNGNHEFDLPIERNSLQAAPQLVDEVYSAAEELGHTAFTRRAGYQVIDDHKPFIDAGIPAMDIIEFDYPEWHTIDDTPENCDAESLRQVGETLIEVVYSRTA